MAREIIIVSGAIGRACIGGKAWVYMQYLLGLQRLGFEVYYLEDCGQGSWVYNWETEETTTDLEYPAAYIQSCLEPIGLGERWIYRAGDQSLGIPLSVFQDICKEALLLIILADPVTVWRKEYDLPVQRAFIDVDPGFTQFGLANGTSPLIETVAHCDRHFTIGQNIGNKDCRIPSAGYDWLKLMPPISLPDWPFADNNSTTDFSSVMDWRGFHDVEYEGQIYGQKDREFPKYLDLPVISGQTFNLAQMGGDEKLLEKHGWNVVPGWIPSATPWSYRDYIQKSRAEFSVAKHGYVESRGGWISDRSVCYLASGRPVLVQDTGQADCLSIGEGMLTFSNLAEAKMGLESIIADYDLHRRAARSLAEQYFDAEKVLPPFLQASLA
ncbi:MAG: glycosyltransferase family 1 protein [Gammaproteobacteria bacterium]|nr:MAG: glycosyltransferase family 1 protein [Gammaproteobacteria bacterium]